MPAIQTAIANLRVLLSENSDVQTWLEHTGDAASALASIIIGGFEESTDPDDIRPYLIIREDPDTEMQLVKIGVDTWVANGVLEIKADKAITADNQNDPSAATTEKNTEWSSLFQFISEASVSEGSGGERIIVQDILPKEFAGFPEIDRPNNIKRYPYWFGVLNVAWGPEGE